MSRKFHAWIILGLFIIISFIFFTGCAGPSVTPCGNVSGGGWQGIWQGFCDFWWGFWNGLTILISLCGSVIWEDIYIIEKGGSIWYLFGLLFGFLFAVELTVGLKREESSLDKRMKLLEAYNEWTERFGIKLDD